MYIFLPKISLLKPVNLPALFAFSDPPCRRLDRSVMLIAWRAYQDELSWRSLKTSLKKYRIIDLRTTEDFANKNRNNKTFDSFNQVIFSKTKLKDIKLEL